MRRDYRDWERLVIDLRAQGKSWYQTAQEVKRRYPIAMQRDGEPLDKEKMVRRCRNVELMYQRAGGAVEQEQPKPAAQAKQPPPLIDLLRQGGTAPEMAARLGVSARVAEAMIQDVKDSGYNIEAENGHYTICRISPPKENRVTEPWQGEKIIRFGLVSDTHLGCVDTQITYLHQLYDRYVQEGITKVYHAGDITDGEKMRPGHEYELYVHGADAQVAHAVKAYPKRAGLTTDFITGNHDYSFIKTVGLDIGRQISALRPDMNYLGYMSVIIQLSPGCTLELRHPQDGSAYALSYKIQKMIDAMSGGEKPNILAVGHYHKEESLFYRNIHAFQAATLCAQTVFMRGKGLSASMGGWIIEAHVDEEGTITRIRPEFFPFYKAIKEDYKNWLVT